MATKRSKKKKPVENKKESHGLPIHPEYGVPYVQVDNSDIMRREEAAKYLGISTTSLSLFAKKGEIKTLISPKERYYKAPTRVYYKPYLDEWKNAQSIYILYDPEAYDDSDAPVRPKSVKFVSPNDVEASTGKNPLFPEID